MEQEKFLQLIVSEYPDQLVVRYAVRAKCPEHGYCWSRKDVTLPKGDPIHDGAEWVAAALATAYDHSTPCGWSDPAPELVPVEDGDVTDAR